MRCVECGTEAVRAAQVCAACGAPPVGATPVIADEREPPGGGAATGTRGSGSGYQRRQGTGHGNVGLSFRSSRPYVLGLISCFVLFIGAFIGIQKAPPFSALSDTMGWIMGLSLLIAVLLVPVNWHARRRIRRAGRD